MILKIWDKESNLYWANGQLATPDEVVLKYPFAQHFPTVLEMAGPLVAAIDSLPVLASVYNIDDALSDEDKLTEIKRIREEAATVVLEPTAQERIAASMEFQNMLALMNMTTDEEGE